MRKKSSYVLPFSGPLTVQHHATSNSRRLVDPLGFRTTYSLGFDAMEFALIVAAFVILFELAWPS